jgi:hypothetical protein
MIAKNKVENATHAHRKATHKHLTQRAMDRQGVKRFLDVKKSAEQGHSRATRKRLLQQQLRNLVNSRTTSTKSTLTRMNERATTRTQLMGIIQRHPTMHARKHNTLKQLESSRQQANRTKVTSGGTERLRLGNQAKNTNGPFRRQSKGGRRICRTEDRREGSSKWRQDRIG